MKGKWEPYSMVLNGEYKYIATRVLDISEPVHGGNLERAGEYTTDRESVVKLCESMNGGAS